MSTLQKDNPERKRKRSEQDTGREGNWHQQGKAAFSLLDGTMKLRFPVLDVQCLK